MPDSSSQVVKISLCDRLTIAKNSVLSLLRDINWLKSLRGEKASNLSNLNWQFNQCQFEANRALSNRHMNTYHNRARILSEIEWERERCLNEWKGLGTKLERFTTELKELKTEISELEEMGQLSVTEGTEGDRSPPWI